jgi:hypothetical protein
MPANRGSRSAPPPAADTIAVAPYAALAPNNRPDAIFSNTGVTRQVDLVHPGTRLISPTNNKVVAAVK